MMHICLTHQACSHRDCNYYYHGLLNHANSSPIRVDHFQDYHSLVHVVSIPGRDADIQNDLTHTEICTAVRDTIHPQARTVQETIASGRFSQTLTLCIVRSGYLLNTTNATQCMTRVITKCRYSLVQHTTCAFTSCQEYLMNSEF